jgi:deazaflavin-dependent oxidoreductase (nitroreductase family)
LEDWPQAALEYAVDIGRDDLADEALVELDELGDPGAPALRQQVEYNRQQLAANAEEMTAAHQRATKSMKDFTRYEPVMLEYLQQNPAYLQAFMSGLPKDQWFRGLYAALLLTTTGRTSGEPRTTPLIYENADDAYVIVASKGGAPEHPGWYRNLAKDPEVEVQVKGDLFPARARTATGEERERLGKLAALQWPPYDDYQQKTDREIPVVVLERA